jgi:hypothetical protein
MKVSKAFFSGITVCFSTFINQSEIGLWRRVDMNSATFEIYRMRFS